MAQLRSVAATPPAFERQKTPRPFSERFPIIDQALFHVRILSPLPPATGHMIPFFSIESYIPHSSRSATALPPVTQRQMSRAESGNPDAISVSRFSDTHTKKTKKKTRAQSKQNGAKNEIERETNKKTISESNPKGHPSRGARTEMFHDGPRRSNADIKHPIEKGHRQRDEQILDVERKAPVPANEKARTDRSTLRYTLLQYLGAVQ